MIEDPIMPQIIAGGKEREDAIRHFYARYATAMMRFFMYRGLNVEEAQDVFQDTVIKIIRNADRYEDNGQENAWFWQIARNCQTDALRKKIRNQQVEIGVEHLEDIAIAAPLNENPAKSLDGCVETGLKSFKQKEPERVYALSLQMNGLSIAEIGTRIGRTVGATKEYLSQCRKKAQPFIAHCYELLGA
jgi:RNA polymerase sigma factor (sigma-70 family)